MLERLRFPLLAVIAAVAGQVAAQGTPGFSARLSWVPISLAEQRLVGGHGEATATLSRGRLTIEGTFEGLPAPATAARLHLGAATGARGPAIADLVVTPSTSGTFTGEVDLDRAQRAALLAGQLYVQLYADPGVPPDDAVLRGWLLGGPAGRSGRGR